MSKAISITPAAHELFTLKGAFDARFRRKLRTNRSQVPWHLRRLAL